MEYQGSVKHKNRPGGGWGTLCPEWTHETPRGGLGHDVHEHPWPQTKAQELFASSEPCPEGSKKRYATERGIAFAARETGCGIWHGYPIPWDEVPDELRVEWQNQGRVGAKDIKRYSNKPPKDTRWPLETDDE